MKVYDNYEISPCRRYEEPGSPGRFYFEVCEPHEADVWTLYGHLAGEGVEAIGDFSTLAHAEETFQRITGTPFAGAREAAERLRVMHAGPKLLEALVSILPYAEAEAEYLDAAADSRTTELAAGRAWVMIAEARAAIEQAAGRPA